MTNSATSSTKGRFIKFAISGAVGFLVELCITLGLVHYVLIHPVIAKLLAFPVAVLTTWVINRNFAFRQQARESLPKELFRYFETTVTGAIANNLIYIGLLSLLEGSAIVITTATAAGALSGMLVNYFGAKHYVFKNL